MIARKKLKVLAPYNAVNDGHDDDLWRANFRVDGNYVFIQPEEDYFIRRKDWYAYAYEGVPMPGAAYFSGRKTT